MKPHGIAVDEKGNVFVSDTGNIGVYMFNLDTGQINQVGPPGGWALPGALAVDNEDGLLAAVDGTKVDIFDLNTLAYKFAIGIKNEFKRPGGIAFDPKRKILYIDDSRKSRLYAYGINGQLKKTVAKAGLGKSGVFVPLGLATDKDGNLYEVDSMNWKIKVFNPDGKEILDWGKHGDRTGMFDRPKALTVTKDNFVMVTDAQFCNFQIFDTKANNYMFFGDPGGKPGRFMLPEGIASDYKDRIYVVDSNNSRVQVFQFMPPGWWAKHPEGLAYFKTHPNGGY